MKLDAHPLTGRRISTLGLAALVSCFMLVGTSEAVAKATTSMSTTQAQKLSKALKACKKQPKAKRAACTRHAQKKYGPRHHITPPPATITPPLTTPKPPVIPPATGPVAPPAPTSAQIEGLVCSFHCPIQNFTILERGVPRLGTGVDTTRGGDGVPSDTWIFPLLLSYDQTNPNAFRHIVCPLPSESCYPGYNETYTEIYHSREKINAQIDAAGGLRIWQQAATQTCEPAVVGCGFSTGGGA
ncbi:MAG TPA: hypothetical protein VNX67_09760 [Solirubrobacteraceae bacterium]|jgi:hypothetical protein|nr:hypothetical protein [Solirubrobacteraceae bacterium]